jgi:hypothetical protein
MRKRDKMILIINQLNWAKIMFRNGPIIVAEIRCFVVLANVHRNVVSEIRYRSKKPYGAQVAFDFRKPEFNLISHEE